MFRKYKAEIASRESRAASQASTVEKYEKESTEKTKEQPKEAVKEPEVAEKPKGPDPNYVPKDTMISYSHQDKVMMQKLREGLEKNGISVWVDVTGLQAGVDFLSKIGQAIIDAKIFISLLSENSIKSKYCQDELALAYVSQKAIFPVGIKPPSQLFPLMDTGMKLQLSRYTWNVFDDENKFEDDLTALVEQIKSSLEEEKDDEATKKEKKKLKRMKSSNELLRQTSFHQKLVSAQENLSESAAEHFWTEHFTDKEEIRWEEFKDKLLEVYRDALDVVFSKADQKWLISILARELEVEDNRGAVLYSAYTEFCTVDEEQFPFWERIQDQAVESWTMKEVFNMESSVRVEAIENLGKFRSPAVVGALTDLLTDPDFNVVAVAAISLARTGANSPAIVYKLMKCLNEKDRLVRESACLALGHLKAETAVSRLVHLWRNDFISSVREAAQIALGQIGGEEADKAIHITKVLSEEIRDLTRE